MTDVAVALDALRDGTLLAVQYNPLVAAVTAAIAAALAGYPKVRRDKRQWSVLVLAVGWLGGDGLRVLARARDVYDGFGEMSPGGSPLWTGWMMLAVWGIGSLAIGYAVPALVGASVGRKVTHGTGWLAAAAIASALTLAVSAAVGALS